MAETLDKTVRKWRTPWSIIHTLDDILDIVVYAAYGWKPGTLEEDEVPQAVMEAWSEGTLDLNVVEHPSPHAKNADTLSISVDTLRNVQADESTRCSECAGIDGWHSVRCRFG